MSPRLLARAHHVGFAGTPVYGLFGTSRQLIVSLTSGSATVSAALITPLALGDPERCAGLAALLAILPGVVYVLLGWRRTGFGSQFVSTSVQIGFLFGLELTIIVGQVAKLLGAPASDGPFFEQLVGLLRSLAQTNGRTIALGGCSLVAR